VGISIVTQELSLAPDLSVLENIFLPELGRPGWLDRGALRKRGLDLLAGLGQADALPLDTPVRGLSAGQKQMVEIAKALGVRAKLIVFDEPTASLSPTEADRLFDIMARLRLSGRGLVLVSHRFEDMVRIADRVSVLRGGRMVVEGQRVTDLDEDQLVRAMLGTDLAPVAPTSAEARQDARPALEVRNLAVAPAVQDVSFAVRPGEILGLGGLVGAGRSEAVEAIFGLWSRQGGTVLVDGQPLKSGDTRAAMRAGLGFVAEDRRSQGIVPDFDAHENLLLAHLGAHRGIGLGYAARQARITALAERLDLPAERLRDASLLGFSGGMQQKVMLARWLLLDPKVLILDEPTKGVDVGTRSAIAALLREEAARGVAIVVVSSDFGELLRLAHRVVVLSDGRTVADVPGAVLDQAKLTLLAAPRAAMARNTALLRDLTEENGGAGFWALIEGGRVICLNSVVADPDADPGFRAGEAWGLDDTRIPQALHARKPVFVSEADRRRATMLVPIRTPRGQDMGWVGLSLPERHPMPPPEAVKFRIDMLASTL
ncbi:MAG: sugar ABC transporter ATP-binding protein, partial [Caulobacteraceae bacterium]|nr:sugar ABC transporter ATP-binding protein [Caulobacter sp.]